MAQMYSLRSAAELLGIKTRTARLWVHNGKLKAMKYPGSERWYVTQEEIERIRGKNLDKKCEM
jgi:excisionase family DNA binding protein